MAPATLLTVAEAAERLRMRPNTLYTWCATGRVPSIRLGTRTIRIRSDTVARIELEGIPGVSRAQNNRSARRTT